MDNVKINVSIAEAERLLDTQYNIYKHKDGTRLARTTSWSLPADLHQHIKTIQPTTSFFHSPVPRKIQKPTKTIQEREIWAPCFSRPDLPTPLYCIKELYKADQYKQTNSQYNSVGIYNYGQYPLMDDISSFMIMYGGNFSARPTFAATSTYNHGPLPTKSLKPGLSETELYYNGEAQIDAEMIFGLTWPVPVTYYSVGLMDDTAVQENTAIIWTDWLTAVLDDPNPPNIISISYGASEQDVSEPDAHDL